MSLALSDFIRDQNRLNSMRAHSTVNQQSHAYLPTSEPMMVHTRRYTGRPEFKWTNRQETHRQNYYRFKHQRKSYHCAICSCLLYESEVFERKCETPLHVLPCNEWGRPPIVIKNKGI